MEIGMEIETEVQNVTYRNKVWWKCSNFPVVTIITMDWSRLSLENQQCSNLETLRFRCEWWTWLTLQLVASSQQTFICCILHIATQGRYSTSCALNEYDQSASVWIYTWLHFMCTCYTMLLFFLVSKSISNLQQLLQEGHNPTPGIAGGPIGDDCELVHWYKDKQTTSSSA